ncbi:protein NYNRIN-like [Brachyhypopomus gauderio]|uniref:protein NYNRIN-like n=1 Tax=Brachyhypopomus gauderio TaxID=698409 RepID=UPI0040421481
MADGMLQGPTHECVAEAAKAAKWRPDLEGELIPGAENMWTDGCGFRGKNGIVQSGFAVVMEAQGEQDEFCTVHSEKPEGLQSAQRAELLAVIAALRLGENRHINIFTDSAYVVGVAHVELGQWERAGYTTPGGKPIKYQEDMKELAAALMLPTRVAIIKCKGHQKGNSLIERGNEAADAAAKKAAGYKIDGLQMVCREEEEWSSLPTGRELFELQEKCSPEEKTAWVDKGGRKGEEVWVGPNGRPILPGKLVNTVLTGAHGVAHVGRKQMKENLKYWWHPYLSDIIVEWTKNCEICNVHNSGPTLKPGPGKFPGPREPGEKIQIDYTDMIIPIRGQRYLLVVVDKFSGWVEAFPTRAEDSKSVCKALINHWIPHNGFPKIIESDNGTHFTSKELKFVEQSLGLRHKYGTVYHPQSQGKVERMNANIKNKLVKVCAQTGMNWQEALCNPCPGLHLPLVLLSIRSSVNSATGFTPFELMTGRSFPGPHNALAKLNISAARSHKEYFKELKAICEAFSVQVRGEEPDLTPRPDLPVTEWVLLKVIKRKWSEPRWTGPFKVTERTSHAVRLKGKGDTWFHLSQCRASEPPIQRAEIRSSITYGS